MASGQAVTKGETGKLPDGVKDFFLAPGNIIGWLTVFIPIALMLGPAPADIACSLIALVFLFNSIRTRDFSWARQPWAAAALLLWAYGFVRTSFSYTEFAGLWQSFVWLRYIVFAAAVAESVFSGKTWEKRFFYSLVAATAFLAADACLQYAAGRDIIGNPVNGNRLTAFFGSPKVGATLSWLFLPAAMFFLREGKKAWAALYGGLCFTAVLLSGDRFALLAVLFGFAFITVFSPAIRKAAIFGWLALALIAAGAMTVSPEIYRRQVESTAWVIGNFPKTSYGLIWKSAIDIAREKPLFGAGIRNFRFVCPDPRYGPEQETKNSPRRCAQHAHNIYLEWLAEGGGIGLLGLLAFVFLVFARLTKNMPDSGGDRLVYTGILATLIMRFWPLASTTSFFNNWAAIPLWLVLGWGLALARRKNP